LTSSTRVIGPSLSDGPGARNAWLAFAAGGRDDGAVRPRARKDRQPDAEQCVECAAEEAAGMPAGAVANQAFGRAVEAARLIPAGQQAAVFAAVQPPAAGLAERGTPAAERAPEETAGAAEATIDTTAVASRVVETARQALSEWAARAVIVGVTVNGPSGRGGTLVGPPVASLMRAPTGAASPAEAAVEARVLGAFAAAFDAWCAAFTMPDIQLWPSLAAVPAPEAPPTPSDPIPLAMLAPAALPLELAAVGDATEDAAMKEAAAALRAFFGSWKSSRTVANLVATGPVPNFGAPYCPVGPACGVASGEPGMIT
jgi:hypothetical protein